MKQPRFHPAARAELEKSALFYDGKFPGLGAEFVNEIEASVAFAYSYPEAGAPVADEFRKVMVERFPYTVVYRAEGNTIYIVAVAHQRRHQDYWHGRK